MTLQPPMTVEPEPDPFEKTLGIDVALKIGALFAFFFFTQGYSYALGLTSKPLHELINNEKPNNEPGLRSTMTAGALHLSYILTPRQGKAWPIIPVWSAGVLFYAAFLAERLRSKSADRANLAFFAALLVAVIPPFVTPWMAPNVLLLLLAPIVVYFLPLRFKHVRIPDAVRLSPWRQMITAAAIAVLLVVGFTSSYRDGVHDKTSVRECLKDNTTPDRGSPQHS